MKRTLSALLIPLFLTACGGSGGSSDSGGNPVTNPGSSTAPLSSSYYGTWSLSGLAYLMLSETSVTTIAYDPELNCWETSYFQITSSTSSSVVSEDILTGETSETSFSLNGSNLVATQGNDQLTFTPARLLDNQPVPGCVNGTNTQFDLSMELKYLPEQVTINRDAIDTGYVEYSYSVEVDMNENGEADAGDIIIMLRHFKGSGDYPDNHQLSLEDIGAQIWFYFNENGSDQMLISSYSTDPFAIPVQRTDNTLSFELNLSQNALLSNLTMNKPMRAAAYINYPEPETEVDNSMADGSWNWTDSMHQDFVPGDSAYFIPNNQAGQTVLDAENDLERGQSQWVDLLSVSVQ